MSEEVNLVADLALILISAGVFTVISKALKQPLILGYIVAGFVVGPHLGLFPKLSSMTAVNEWSEIGIVFLLFALGLEFSFKKLMQVGSSALIVAAALCVGMFTIGFTVGNAIGWTSMESIFLGGMMSMSSTTIIIKAYDDLGIKNKPFASLVFGTLVVEDLIAVLLMVLLSTLAISNKFAGKEMLMGLTKLGFFLVLSFVIGVFVIPTVLKKAKAYLTDEILLIVSIGLCFGMVSIATSVGFSAALGAFLMGSVLSASVEGERIEKLVSSIKDLFGAIFFVSVGMMVDPHVIAQNWGTVIVLTIAAMAGIVLIGTTGSILAGNNLENSVHTGFSLAQLGEFSFIIAGLGCSLGVVRDFIYPLIIAVSVLTTFTTPYMIKAAGPATQFLQRKLPAGILSRINENSGSSESSNAERNLWMSLIKSYVTRVLLYAVLLVSILVVSKSYLDGAVEDFLPNAPEKLRCLINVLITLVVMSPFLYGMAVTGGSINNPAKKLLQVNDNNKWPILSLMILRIFIAIAFVIAVIESHFSLSGGLIFLIVIAMMVFFFWAKVSVHRFAVLEQRFIANLNENEMIARMRTPVSSSVKDKLSGYDVHIEIVEVSPNYRNIGKTLKELPIRKQTGVNILKIQRGAENIVIPSGDERIYPNDKILAVGTSAQIEAFMSMMHEDSVIGNSSQMDFNVDSFTLGAESYMIGKSLLELDMRKSGCVVISVLRGDDFMTNPKPEMKFQEGDTVWIAGEKDSIAFYMD